tara:strand:- start:3986 stop:4168 length:183 start_codon:yes stop_codon:yes gene_type:complete
MAEDKIPCFYTSLMDKLDNLDVKVNEIQNSIRIFKSMINERMDVEKYTQPEKTNKADTNE